MSTADTFNSMARFLIKYCRVNVDLTKREAMAYEIFNLIQMIVLIGYCAIWLFILLPRGYQIIPGLSFKNPNPSHLSRAISEFNMVIAGVVLLASFIATLFVVTCARNKIRIHWLSKFISFFVKDLYEAEDKKNQDSNDVSRNP
jgi:hypothetical protein